ncbi:potassium-transporting ATPase subunit C, partial [Duodenibacillus massiliensis]
MKNALLFEGRPSATGEKPYNPMASTGTNMAQSNPDLQKA